MITLLILIITFLLLMLAIIWGHFFRSNNTIQDHNNELRDQTNIQLYQEHKAEIEKDFNREAIDEESYQYLITELDKSFLQDMTASEKEAAKFSPAINNNMSWLWPAFITLFILAFTITLYQKQGSYAKLSSNLTSMPAENNTAMADNSSETASTLAKIKELKLALKKTPKDSNLWYSLGQANIGIGDFNAAVNAFDQVIKIEGKKAELLGAKAQAIYYGNGQKMNTDVQTLIDQALALDSLDPSTNVLLGMDNFIHQRYQKAIHHWQMIVDSGRKNINIEALTGAINEARNRLAGTLNSGSTTKNSTTDSNTNSPKLTLNISLSKQFQQALAQGDDKTVFVYATPTDGRRMPLAAMKIKISDLPTTIELTNAQAMSPQFNLGSAKTVHIFAVISQQGTPGIKSGDYKAELKNVAVSTIKPIELKIDQLVP